jgi:hypothetical protein
LLERTRSGNRKSEDADKIAAENPHIGSSLDDFLKKKSLLEEVWIVALVEMPAGQIQKSINIAKRDSRRFRMNGN